MTAIAAPAAVPVFERTIIDYLRVTSDAGRFMRDVLRPPVERMKRGLGVYPFAERDGFGTVYCAGGPEGGRYMLQMSGEPLEAWRAERKESDLVVLLASRGARCSRLDLARDTTGDWTPYRLRDYLQADRYVTTWRRAPIYTQEQNGPLTVYLGSRQSDFMVRVYDKRGELLAKEKPCPHERLSRWEEQINNEVAASAFWSLWTSAESTDLETGEFTEARATPVDRMHADGIGCRLRLTTEPVDRANKDQSRAVTDPAWIEFLAASSGEKLLPGMDARTPAVQAAEFARAFARSNAGSLSTFVELVGAEGLAELLRVGALRRSAKHRMFIERKRETARAAKAALGWEFKRREDGRPRHRTDGR